MRTSVILFVFLSLASVFTSVLGVNSRSKFEFANQKIAIVARNTHSSTDGSDGEENTQENNSEFENDRDQKQSELLTRKQNTIVMTKEIFVFLIENYDSCFEQYFDGENFRLKSLDYLEIDFKEFETLVFDLHEIIGQEIEVEIGFAEGVLAQIEKLDEIVGKMINEQK